MRMYQLVMMRALSYGQFKMSAIVELAKENGIKFEYYDPYPKKHIKDLNDCYIRAICKATGLEYDKVYYDLFDIAKRDLLQMNDNSVITSYLGRFNYKVTFPNNKVMLEFMIEHKEGRYLIATKKHIVAYIDGVFYDTNINSNVSSFVVLNDFLQSKIHKYYVFKD